MIVVVTDCLIFLHLNCVGNVGPAAHRALAITHTDSGFHQMDLVHLSFIDVSPIGYTACVVQYHRAAYTSLLVLVALSVTLLVPGLWYARLDREEAAQGE